MSTIETNVITYTDNLLEAIADQGIPATESDLKVSIAALRLLYDMLRDGTEETR